MRGGFLRHVFVFVVAVFPVRRFFVCAGCVACFACYVCCVLIDGDCYVLHVVMHAWRLCWSCLGLCDRRSCCHLRKYV